MKHIWPDDAKELLKIYDAEVIKINKERPISCRRERAMNRAIAIFQNQTTVLQSESNVS